MAVITVKVEDQTIAKAKKYFNEVYVPLNNLSLVQDRVTKSWLFGLFTWVEVESPNGKMLNDFIEINGVFGLFMWNNSSLSDSDWLCTTSGFDLINTIATFMGPVTMGLSSAEFASLGSFNALDVDAIALKVKELK